ncbi:MAG: hypothetical protein L0Y50_10255 [Beijerinckiaceae bacterium]|nr:hypothetical protein [Beijerinckiaceae bacterium]
MKALELSCANAPPTTAIVHGLILVTRNAADFDYTSISIVNPRDRG